MAPFQLTRRRFIQLAGGASLNGTKKSPKTYVPSLRASRLLTYSQRQSLWSRKRRRSLWEWLNGTKKSSKLYRIGATDFKAIKLGDRAFCAYADMVAITKLGCDPIFCKHQSLTTTMLKGKIAGDCDKLVTWYKPKSCPKGLNKHEFDALPSSITVREIYYYIVIPGFCTQQVSLITTLLDKGTYSTLEIVGLYGKRWDVELDLRHIKTTLGMDILRCKSPSMVRK